MGVVGPGVEQQMLSDEKLTRYIKIVKRILIFNSTQSSCVD